MHHVKACQTKQLLPISGVEAYFRPNRLIARKFKQRQAWHLCLFAKNLKGWHNLLHIVSTAFQDPVDGGGFYQYPCVDWDLLRRYREGLACTSACISSYLSTLILDGDNQEINSFIDQMLTIFGEDFWIEIMPHDFDDQRTLNETLVTIAHDRSIPLLATNDAHFPFKEWAETQRVAKMAGSNSSFKKAAEEKLKGKAAYLAECHPTLYIASEAEMLGWFGTHHREIPAAVISEAMDNTQLFTSKITPFMLDKTNKLPTVHGEGMAEPEKVLREWIDEGWERIQREYEPEHWGRWTKESYLERIETEWAVLKNKGVIDYFVLVGDMIRWAKSQKIRVGLGRGSAAGCLISYLVGIVAIDPIPWGLLFERFLNPERKGLPDIDIDFQSDRRAEVKAYLQDKPWCDGCGADHEGTDHVADIITHQRFQPKLVLQSICRVFDVPFLEAKAVTDRIEIRQDSEETTLEELLPLIPELQQFKAGHEDLWEHALRLEGTVANAGKHAAGVIITPLPVAHYMALERGKAGDLITSWSDSADFTAVSDHGFVKIDFLGIRGLAKHDYACKLIKKRHGIDLDLNKLPVLHNPYLVDDRVLEGFRKGYTIGVFQFGSAGITNLIKQIAPSDAAFDLSAANALYRPGPMKGGVTWEYARRKRADKEDPEWYWHGEVEPILHETYGLICYQEQVMEIAKHIGGFTGAQADDMRKAMGKLYRIKGGSEAKTFMKQYEVQWYKGCEEKEIPKRVADEIWHKLLEFGHYGFNKSHSASYALQAYQDMYLKMLYGLEMYAALLTYEPDEDKKMIMVREARGRTIGVLPPSINVSNIGWVVDDEADALRFGLASIKGVGEKGAAGTVTARAGGDFVNWNDFRERVPKRAINAKASEALLESGAFDEWGAREDFGDEQIALWEKQRLGMSLTVPSKAEKYADVLDSKVWSQEEVDTAGNGVWVVVGGEITKLEKKTTKKGDPFANMKVVYGLNEWSVKLWKEALREYEPILSIGNTILVSGKTNVWNDFVSVVASDVTDRLDQLQEA